MISKVVTGIKNFDLLYGGVFDNRPSLICGAKGTGKTTFALSFLYQGLKSDERGLILSTTNSKDLAIFGESIGMPVNAAVDNNKLFLLEYSSFVPGRDRDDNIMLPPDGFMQLQMLIEEQAIDRVVIDTVLPWVAIDDYNRLAEHVFSFIRAFERINVSCLFTMPKPVSTPAIRLRHLMQQNLPISVSLRKDEFEKHYINVDKYIGSNVKPGVIDFESNFSKGLDKARVPLATNKNSVNIDESDLVSPFESLDFESGNSIRPRTARRVNTRNREEFDEIDFVDSFDIGNNAKRRAADDSMDNNETMEKLKNSGFERFEMPKDSSKLDDLEKDVIDKSELLSEDDEEQAKQDNLEKIDYSSFVLEDDGEGGK
ncbi:MAG: hypothetical protein PF692_09435 [Kiritimatiellae bacterium]|jgi:KaiC/GvpD/RAD55 family RecA-like ATPase|nr:hypothetical protein [Kiritimatiellia bacterium]